MKKKIALTVAGAGIALGGVGLFATPAAANHQHYIDTPQGLRVNLPCEQAETPAETMHIRHLNFHLNSGQAQNAITVARYDFGSCSDPLPSGPNR